MYINIFIFSSFAPFFIKAQAICILHLKSQLTLELFPFDNTDYTSVPNKLGTVEWIHSSSFKLISYFYHTNIIVETTFKNYITVCIYTSFAPVESSNRCNCNGVPHTLNPELHSGMMNNARIPNYSNDVGYCGWRFVCYLNDNLLLFLIFLFLPYHWTSTLLNKILV